MSAIRVGKHNSRRLQVRGEVPDTCLVHIDGFFCHAAGPAQFAFPASSANEYVQYGRGQLDHVRQLRQCCGLAGRTRRSVA